MDASKSGYPKSKQARRRLKKIIRDLTDGDVDIESGDEVHIHIEESGVQDAVEELGDRIVDKLDNISVEANTEDQQENDGFEVKDDANFEQGFDVEGSFGDGELG